MMTKPSYPALFHFINKALAQVSFPASKQEILNITQGVYVNTDWDEQVLLSEFLNPIKKENYDNACELYSSIIAEFKKN